MKEFNHLVLVRHGQSEWNAKNLFTGWRDPDLTQLGIDEAEKGGELLIEKQISFDVLYTSVLIRSINTAQIILKKIGQEQIPTFRDEALNERNYGDLAGLNKDDARKRWGEEQVHIWRRSYDVPPPGGESLKDTAERVLPYFNGSILPKIIQGGNILVAAHGNSLRSLVMQLDNLSKEEVVALEIPTGAPIIYSFQENEKPILKENLFE